MSKKDFKKGDRVSVIEDWNFRGLVSVRHATVHSCGTKVLRLTCDATGDEFGRALSPRCALPDDVGVRPLLEGDALDAEALEVSLCVIANHRCHLDQHLADGLKRINDGDGTNAARFYVKHKQNELDALYDEPVWALYADLIGRVKRELNDEVC